MFDVVFTFEIEKMELPQGLVTVAYTIILLILTTTVILIAFTVLYRYGYKYNLYFLFIFFVKLHISKVVFDFKFEQNVMLIRIK